MIYSASLSLPVKKAFGDKAMQSSTPKIISMLNEDPTLSTMDTVVLGPKDGAGPRGKQLAKAMPKAHPDINFIYLYNKDSEEGVFNCANKAKLRKTTANTVRDAVEDFMQGHITQAGKARVTSADFTAPGAATADFGSLPVSDGGPEPDFMSSEPIDFSAPLGAAGEGGSDDTMPIPDFSGLLTEGSELGGSNLGIKPEPTVPEPAGLPTQPLRSGPVNTEPSVSTMPSLSLEASISNVKTTEDWEMFKMSLNRENVIRRLIEENTEFQGLINIIETLDYKIMGVWKDTALSAEDKFDKIKQIGLDRSVAVATANSVITDKVINIITKITLAAKRTVEEKLDSYDVAMYKVATSKLQLTDASQVDHAIQERATTQFELLALARKIVDLYMAMDLMVNEEIKELDSKLPSSNEFINNMCRPIGSQIFTPTNTAELAKRLAKALNDNRVTMSEIESKVKSLIELLFEMFKNDSDIIEYQQNLIAMLRAHHVEDVVIVDTVIKNMLRIFTGADGTGRSATAITYCGIMSRRHNCLLIDLTGKAKFSDYGITPMSLEDFMRDRVKKQFLCVQASRIPAPDELQEIIEELKTRLDYYPYVNLIMDPSDIDGIEQASTDAKTIHYICNCTSESMDTIKETIENHTYKNIARKLILIDPPISPLAICDRMGVDISLFKLVILPNMPEIRAGAIQHDRPYEYEQVIRIFEEAFR